MRTTRAAADRHRSGSDRMMRRQSASRRRRWTVRVIIAVAVVIVGGTAATAAVGLDWSRETEEAARDRVPATTPVTRQTLVETRSESGELGYDAPVELSARAGGTVTSMAGVGTVVQRGQTLFRIDDKPVILLVGTLPAYRALSSGLEGADVKQFETNLAALGYDGFTVDERYSSSTASAVKEWQEDLGIDETGVVDLGRVVYAAASLRVDGHAATVGQAVQASTAVLTCAGTARVATVELDISDARLAPVGAAVEVSLPTGKKTGGKVVATETVVDDSEGGGDDTETTLEVTVSIDDQTAVSALERASVTVAFTASKRANVLTVPVGALLALAEGGYGVEIVEGTSSRVVAVETGLFAGGRVEVSGGGLTEGMTVGVPS
ncbi:peptidoglycan-binding domain-containing protein [Actinomycetes bacterium KLBMP 9797]